MHKLIFLFLTSFYSLFANTLVNDEKLDILAKEISSKGDVVTATGDVVAYSPSYYITAQKLIYDKAKRTLEFFEDVSIVRQNSEASFSEYMFLNLKDEIKTTEPVVLIDSNKKMWFSSKKIDGKQDQYNFDSTTFSSCECENPDWSVLFSSGDFDSEAQWINMYNTTLYIKDIPVLYTPYFGFSTNRTRHSGLLPPIIGFSGDEGFHYEQPIYYAPAIDYDFEYIPQIKTSRGYGHNLKYRYVDSPYSKLEIEGGVFYENDSYFEEKDLVNKKHYGWTLEYDRSKLLSQGDHQDGLEIYLTDMNDIDYSDTTYFKDTDYDRYVNSSIKYFYNTNDYYGGIEVKRYEDIRLDNYDETLQDQPIIKLHKYTQSIFFDNLTYSANVDLQRQKRDRGMGVERFSLNVPITYTQSFLDGYLDLSFGSVIDYSYLNYLDNSNDYINPTYGTISNFVEVGTNLIRPYENFVHAAQVALRYENPHSFVENGDIYSINTADPNLSDLSLSEGQEEISIYFNQSFYNDNLETVMDHTVSHNWIYDEVGDKFEKGTLEHDLKLYYGYANLSNRFYYDYELDKIIKSTTTLTYNDQKKYLRLYYTFDKNTATLDNQEYFTYQIGYNFDKYYSISHLQEYDLTNNVNQKREYALTIDKQCWAVTFKYINSIIATNTTKRDYKRQNAFYVEVNLKELLSFIQKY